MPLGSEMGGTFISAFWCKGKGKPVRRKLFKEAALSESESRSHFTIRSKQPQSHFTSHLLRRRLSQRWLAHMCCARRLVED